MIPCDEVRRHLLDYQFDLLTDWETEEVRLHLRDCFDCRSASTQVRSETVLFDSWRVENAPSDAWQRFGRRVQTELGLTLSRRKNSRFLKIGGPWRYQLAFAVLLLGVITGAFTLRRAANAVPVDDFAGAYSTIPSMPHPGQFTAHSRVRLAAWLASDTGFPSHAPDLCPEGIDLLGVRTMRLRGRTAGVWIYRMNPSNVLLFEQADDGVPFPRLRVVQCGRHQFYWQRSGGITVLLWRGRGRIFCLAAPPGPKPLSMALAHCLEREGWTEDEPRR